jgi:hypothetical protein
VTAAAAANPRAFPPLVDMYSRTLGAAFVDERAGGGVSCKIASFLTPTSTLFVIDTHEKKIISTGYTPYSDADYIEPLPVAPEAINLLQVCEFESNGRLRVREADFKVPHDLRDSGAK